jgi:hypothetical protein
VDDLPAERVLNLVGHGPSGACLTGEALAQVAEAVLAVAAGGVVVLPPARMASVVTNGARAGAGTWPIPTRS